MKKIDGFCRISFLFAVFRFQEIKEVDQQEGSTYSWMTCSQLTVWILFAEMCAVEFLTDLQILCGHHTPLFSVIFVLCKDAER
jgi:hypothetical protein